MENKTKEKKQKSAVKIFKKITASTPAKMLTTGLILISLLAITGCGGESKKQEKVQLEYWGVWNEASEIEELTSVFNAKYPYVTINYRKLRYEEYQDTLITAWAQDKGPDIFSVPNSWVGAYRDFIEPMPPATTMINEYIKTSLWGLKEDLVREKKEIPGYNTDTLGRKFVDVVVSDVVMQEQIYGLPLSMDTLALYYNKDLLAQARIPQPPTSWSEFVEIVPKLTLQNNNSGEIVRSAVSLGTVENMERPVDVLTTLMIQNGTQIISPSGQIQMAAPSSTDEKYFPGPEALKFYTDFALPTKKVYTWNEDMPNALEAFTQGKTAFFFGYAYHLPLITNQAQGINFDITYLPQISSDQNTTLANYWIETVAKKSAYHNEAWAFLQFATSEDGAIPFLDASKKPTALRSLVSSQANENPKISSIILQGLAAKSWYHGQKPVDAETILKNAIKKILNGEAAPQGDKNIYQTTLEEAAEKLQITL